MGMKVQQGSKGKTWPFFSQLDTQGKDYRGITAILITAGSLYAIYKNRQSPMVFFSAAGAALGSCIAWAKNASWTNQIKSAIGGAFIGALSAKFLPETAGKVHQTVMGYFGVTFEASKDSSAEVVSGDDRHSDVDENSSRTFEFISESGESSQRPGVADLFPEEIDA